MANSSPNNNQLHSLLSLAEISAALTSTTDANDTSNDLSIRLPLLLRHLCASQSTTSIDVYFTSNEDKVDDKAAASSALDAELIVSPLEEVAASHSGAENLEILVSTLAPSICRDVSKLHPLKRKFSDRQCQWNVEVIRDALEKLSGTKNGREEKKQRLDVVADADEMEESEESSNEHTIDTSATKPDTASNDSHESSARRTLRELLSLVLASLTSSTPGIVIKSESMFAESTGGGVLSLSVMLVSLMHSCGVLRYDHIATALCRAVVPQTPILIRHMAANCPGVAVPLLLRGIIQAYKWASGPANTTEEDFSSGPKVEDIRNVCTKSCESVASLSSSEAYVVICALKEHEIMDDLVLELLISRDVGDGALFLVEKLEACVCEEEDSVEMPEAKPKFVSRQSTISDVNTFDTDGRVKEQYARPLSLRQRMLSRRSRSDDAVSKTHQTTSMKNAKSSQVSTQLNFANALSKNSLLAESCLQCISSRIAALVGLQQSTNTVCFGEVEILLRAFARLVHNANISKLDYAQVIGSMTDLVNVKMATAEMPDSSSGDDVYKLVFCAAIITWSKCLWAKDSTDPTTTNETPKVCQECIQSLLLQSKSLECGVFASRLCGFVIHSDAEGMRSMILHQIYPGYTSVRVSSLDFELEQLSNAINEMLSFIGKEQLDHVHKAALTADAVLYNPIVAIDAIRRSDMPSNNLDDLIKNLLSDPKSCDTLSRKPMACEFLHESVGMVSRRAGPHIPIVLPVTLERVASSIPWSSTSTDTANFHELFSQFVMQLIYALLFLEKEPTSPFAINPRTLPLKETLRYAWSGSFNGHSAVCALLEQSISKHCPDLVSSVKNSRLLNCGVSTITSHESVTPSLVYEAIRGCLDTDSSVDQSGLRAEQLYLMSSPHHLTSELDVAVVSAVLPSRHSHTKFISYLALCRDPLVILKARALAWKSRGIRRLLLRVLHNIMDANESIVLKCCDNPRVAQEFLASRDSIIVRCLLFAQTKLCFEHCVMSVNMVRSIISRRAGTVATLLKQGMDDGLVDYLVKFVPESFSDAPILSSLLSQKARLSALNRLTLADASLRIAIAHCLRGEAIAKGLVSVSLTVLVESFHLVLGPTGVPVSILRQVDGQDATDICRNALFRMISYLSTIEPDSALKGCAVPAIGKISSMCKSESASVGGSGVAAARRKALLKEIWEVCVLANNALGGEIQI